MQPIHYITAGTDHVPQSDISDTITGTKMMKPRQTARAMGVSMSTLTRKRIDGTGPTFVKISRGRSSCIRYRVEDVEAWIAARTFKTTAQAAAVEIGPLCPSCARLGKDCDGSAKCAAA